MGKHGPKAVDPKSRFWPKVHKDGPILVDSLGPCWIWTASRTKFGYGRFGDFDGVTHSTKLAYGVAYRWLIGEVPNSLELDHLCRNPSCVNPYHLEPVTSQENTVVRGIGVAAQKSRQTHCVRGHPLSGTNLKLKTNGCRSCRECSRMRDRKRNPFRKRNR